MLAKRNINLGRAKKTDQKKVQEKYFVRLVSMHPKYRLILESLKEGVKASTIAAHFAENSWLTVNERTFSEAIRVFKTKHADLIDSEEGVGLDKIVDPNRPHVDLRDQLQQLLRMQRLRVGIALAFEKQTGVPDKSIFKDIDVTNKLIETLAKIEGKITDGGGRGHVTEERDVAENLNRIKRDQVTRDRLHTAVKQLVKQEA